MNTLLTLATTPAALVAVAAACLAIIVLALRSLRRDAAEDARVAAFLSSIQLSGRTWDCDTTWTGLSDRTDTASFPAIVLAGTVTR